MTIPSTPVKNKEKNGLDPSFKIDIKQFKF